MDASLETELEAFLVGIGFELVAMERGGGRRRPLLRLRVDRVDSQPGPSGVTVDDCAAVSRAVTGFLEERGTGEDQWVLEVSSPGIDRPLRKAADFHRFAGRRVRLRGFGPLLGDSRQVTGVLVGVEPEGPDGEQVVVQVNEERVSVPLSSVSRATLAFDFGDDS